MCGISGIAEVETGLLSQEIGVIHIVFILTR